MLRAVSEGNGHVTTPVTKAPPGASVEIGATGLQASGGRVQDEFHRNLRGDRARRVYREMSDNDPVIGGILFAIEMLCREVEWRAEPQDPECPTCLEEAQFLEECRDDMSLPWPQVIGAALSMLPYGWAYLETVYKLRGGLVDDAKRRSKFDDGRIGWRKHALRVQESLVRWSFDEEGGIQGMVQATSQPGKREVLIPIEKSLLFRTTAARGNPEGRSVLRNAYRAWYFKKRIEEIEAIGIERDLAGLPVALVPQEYLDPAASANQLVTINRVKDMLRDIRQDDQTSVVFPKVLDDAGHDLWELKLLSTGGRRAFDTDKIVARYDQRMAMTVLADFILLGHEAVGSKALGVSKVELFTTALAAYLDEIGTVFNDYGVPRLMMLNAVDQEHWPTLAHDEVEQVDLTALGTYVRDISGAGVAVDDDLNAWLREAAGMPQPSEDQEAIEEATPVVESVPDDDEALQR